MRLSRPQIIARLEAEGFTFLEFQCIWEGNHAAEDAEWTYRDCAHVDIVHDGIRPVFCVVGSDYFGSIHLQTVLGLRFPFTHVHYVSAPHCHTYYATFLVFVAIIETGYEQIAPNRTRVITTYSVGTRKALKWSLPFIRWLITRNARNLQSGDIPMRERRAELRLWGYSFYKESSRYSFEETLDISESHVIPPEAMTATKAMSISIEKELPGDGELFLGRDDHLGVRVVRSQNQIMVFPRMCLHEGAALDCQKLFNKRIICPWHGRVFAPLAVFDLSHPPRQLRRTNYHQISLMDGTLTIECSPRFEDRST